MGYRKCGDNMSPRTGRPKSDNPKTNPIHVRLDQKSCDILDRYCIQNDVTRAEGIRRGIEKLEADLENVK